MSAAYTDNTASLAVSQKTGYRDNGVFRYRRRADELAHVRKLALSPADFVRGQHRLAVAGVSPFRDAIGLADYHA